MALRIKSVNLTGTKGESDLRHLFGRSKDDVEAVLAVGQQFDGFGLSESFTVRFEEDGRIVGFFVNTQRCPERSHGMTIDAGSPTVQAEEDRRPVQYTSASCSYATQTERRQSTVCCSYTLSQ